MSQWRVRTYNHFIDELINEHEIGTQSVFLQCAAEVIDATHNRLEQFEGEGWQNLATR